MGGPSLDLWTLSAPVSFVLSHGRVRLSHHVLLRLRTEDGDGWGSSPLYDRSPHELPSVRRHLLAPLLSELPNDVASARALAASHLVDFPDVLNALDQALWELEARHSGTSVARLLGATPPVSVSITEQLFVLEPQRAVELATTIRARGVGRIKVKLRGDAREDVRLVRAIRDAVGPTVSLRPDANQAYGLEQASSVAGDLADLGVQEWEEPVAGGFRELAALRSATPLRVMLDESVRTRADLDDALDAGALDALNLKLGRIGGITTAAGFRHDCASAGVDVVIGCAEDVGPGMAAILHAAAAWNPRATEGVGWMRLGVDIAAPSPQIDDGAVTVTDAPGWGLELEPSVMPVGTTPRGAQLIHEADWNLRFAGRSWVSRQRQRVDVARARARRVL